MSGKLVLSKFGGVNKAHQMLNIPYTTVHYWWEHDFIPADRQKYVLSIARENKLDVTPETFFMEYEL